MARLIDAAVNVLDRSGRLIPACIAVVFIVSSLCAAARKPLWSDELGTLLPGMLPGWRDVVAFYANGGDVHTPFASLLTKAALAFSAHTEVITRLPLILGYTLGALCVYAFVLKRSNALYATAAMLIMMCARGRYYAIELRPYALEVGLAALAIICWRAYGERSAIKWLAALTMVLTAALLFHPYAAFLWIPLGAAEVVRWFERKRIDWFVPVAMVLAVLPLLPFLPGIAHAKAMLYQPNWPHPTLVAFLGSYGLNLSLPMGTIILAVAVWALFRTAEPATVAATGVKLAPTSEQILIALMMISPLFAIIGSAAMRTGVYNDRYVLYTIVALAIGFAYLCYIATSGRPALGVALTLCLGLQFALTSFRDVRSLQSPAPGTLLGSAAWVRAAQASNLPVVIESWDLYPQFLFYGPADVRQRTYFLTRGAEPDGRIYSDDFSLMAWGKPLGWLLVNYKEFVAKNRQFLLYYNPQTISLPLDRMLPRSASMRVVLQQREDNTTLLEVTIPEPQSTVSGN